MPLERSQALMDGEVESAQPSRAETAMRPRPMLTQRVVRRIVSSLSGASPDEQEIDWRGCGLDVKGCGGGLRIEKTGAWPVQAAEAVCAD